MKLQFRRICRLLYWHVYVNASDVPACNHPLFSLHTAIRSVIHTVYHVLVRARNLICKALNRTYRTKNKQFSVDVISDLCKLRLTKKLLLIIHIKYH
jgi:hypothetical protein